MSTASRTQTRRYTVSAYRIRFHNQAGESWLGISLFSASAAAREAAAFEMRYGPGIAGYEVEPHLWIYDPAGEPGEARP